MFVVAEGCAEIEIEEGCDKYGHASKELNPGESWGEETLLSFESEFLYSVWAVSDVEVLMIPHDMFSKRFTHFRDAVNTMRLNLCASSTDTAESFRSVATATT